MAITRLNLVTIHFSKEHYNEVSLKLLEHNDFNPEPASKFTGVDGLRPFNQENPYGSIVQKFIKEKEQYGFDLQEVSDQKRNLSIMEGHKIIDKLFNKLDKIEHVYQSLQTLIAENEEAIIQLQHVANSNLNFDDLFASRYLEIRFGKLPVEYLTKLDYYTSLPFVFTSFKEDQKYMWCMYITTPKDAPEIDNIFSSLYFERIYIPKFVHGRPDLAIDEIRDEIMIAKNECEHLKQQAIAYFEENKELYNYIYTQAKRINDIYILQPYIVDVGSKLAIYGFVPKRKSSAFKKSLEAIEGIRVDVQPPNSDVRLEPPTKLKNHWFSKPFGIFVEMYGVPNYYDIDPTVFVAVSYTLLFGIMFGDVGQGIILSILGYICYRWKGLKLGEIGMRIGISSVIFGILFGSVFGSEHILMPFFNPMDVDSATPLLIVAIGLGVIFIIISMCINIFLTWRKKQYATLLFNQNGICGLLFYLAIIGLIINMALGMHFVTIWYTIFLLVLPLIGMFLQEPLHHLFMKEKMFPEGFGSFFIEGFFELFEIVLSFVTNTLSFLRVGGFVLSHAGMMLVVYTIAEMVGGVGYWAVLVFGNIFVMCLEGLIVGIQVLRLEFYEMFSRYYEGNGKPFLSIKEQ